MCLENGNYVAVKWFPVKSQGILDYALEIDANIKIT